mgnify:CR=1 FL=1
MRVPWRRVASWHCTACGKCCREYTVRLNFYEYLRLKNTGFVEEKAGKYYIKKFGKMCPFQTGNYCMLQKKNKPMACKLFPFIILKKGEKEALYEFNGEEYYVYVELGCPNLKLGKPENMEILVKEAIQLYLGIKKMPFLQYHPQLEYPHCLQILQPSSYTKGEPQSGHTPTGAFSVTCTDSLVSFSLFSK